MGRLVVQYSTVGSVVRLVVQYSTILYLQSPHCRYVLRSTYLVVSSI